MAHAAMARTKINTEVTQRGYPARGSGTKLKYGLERSKRNR